MYIQLDKKFNSVLDFENDANDKDYEIMIKEFRTKEARNKHIQKNVTNQILKQSQKLKALNIKWRQSIDKYRESREHFFSEERESILKKMDERTVLTKKHLKETKLKKMQFMTEIQSKNVDAVQNIKKNLEYTYQENENNRLTLQEQVEDKINKLSTKNKRYLEGIRIVFENNSYKSLQNFNKNYTKVKINNDKITLDNIEKPIKKYENWVYNLANLQYVGHHTKTTRNKDNKKQANDDKQTKKLEYLEDMELERE